MSFAKIHGPLTSRIGRPVKFGAPQDVDAKGGAPAYGTIVDEVWAEPIINMAAAHEQPCDPHCWGDYSFCAQLIKWNEGGHNTIRLAYYRRRCGENFWTFASQMTINAEPHTIEDLCRATLAKTHWFAKAPTLDPPLTGAVEGG